MPTAYSVVRKLYTALTPAYETVWTQPLPEGPCVFICNHAGAFGPVDMVCKFPLQNQLHIWCNEGIMNTETCPDYIRQDYWWRPDSRLAKLWSATIPPVANLIIPRILQRAPVIPVYHDARVMTTMRRSIKALQQGEYVVIFPEQPSGFQAHHDWINTGWMPICTLWQRVSGEALRLVPVHIDYKKHRFTIAPPVLFDTGRSLDEQREELAAKLAQGLRGQST